MALNPVAYTEKVVRSFLRYQLTTHPFADPDLHAQMRRLLSLRRSRRGRSGWPSVRAVRSSSGSGDSPPPGRTI